MNGDEAKAWYNPAGGGSLHTRQQNSSCQTLDVSQLKSFGVFEDALRYASSMWGPDWDNITTNLPDYPNQTAYSCAPNQPVQEAYWTTPTCANQTLGFTGCIKRGNSTAQVNVRQGTSVTTSTLVQHAIEFGSRTQYTVWVGIPLVFKIAIVETIYAFLVNTNGHRSTTTDDARTFVTQTVSCPGPAIANASVSLQACWADSQVAIPLTVYGWLWFHYGTKRQNHYLCP
ncbi:uncharacterized protein EI90DRAFT_3030892 [Cantharellus anzutake]|uniref:uncharacterized protein n=1 Tax=Cantharellus anzutake TaxID=1750568 RepID=UPI001907B549|nr:uncharacterized protein EI90DRAFT_3030892 [Cantharellus anzutake]KAF8342969.1 hypothetical protein EI90DRAFT_3030892 [Cantharellus anzutake]